MTPEAGESGDDAVPIDRRAELTELAIELISEEGLSACTFRRLAEKAGTSTRAFTYQFGSRSELLRAVLERAWDISWPDRVEAAELDRVDDPLRVFYEICLHETEGRSYHHSNAYLEFLKAAPFDPEIAEWLTDLDRKMMALYRDLVAAAQAKGQIGPDLDPEDVVTIMWGHEDGMALGRRVYPAYFTEDRMRRLLDTVFDSLLGLPDGIRPRAPSRDP